MSVDYEECMGAKKHLVYASPCWPAVKLIRDWSQMGIGTTVEAIIRRWCRHVGGNNFTACWQVVITIRQHRCLYRHTVVSSTAGISVAISKIGVDIMS